MPNLFARAKEFFLNLLFPPCCINCQSEESYLCQDCLSLIDISPNQYCPFCRRPKIVLGGGTCNFCKRTKNLNGLYSAAPYQNFIIKKAIAQFKYEPYIKALSRPLSLLIIKHFQLLEHPSVAKGKEERMLFEHPLENPSGSNGTKEVLVPIPLAKKRLRQRGYNQSEEIAKELSSFLAIPLILNCLVKIKETASQVELSGSQREENVKGVFFCENPDTVRGKKIFLVDDVFTTGSTMEECALTLKRAGAKEVWGIVVARE